MPHISQRGTSVTRIASLLLALLCVSMVRKPLASQAVPFPGSIPVGSSALPVSVQVTLSNGGTISQVKLFGQGTPNVDFVGNGGTCTQGASFLAGQTCNLNVVFTPASPGARRGAVVLLDGSNAVIGSQLLSASATGSVSVFVPGEINTIAGTATWVYDGDGRTATSTAIFLPFGIAVDAAGDLFIADSSNSRIRRVDAVTQVVSTIAGNGYIGATGDGGPATNASLSSPSSLALDPAGNLFFSDSGNNAIRRIDAFTGIITTVAGKLGHSGYGGDNGPANSATFNSPNGISFDANGNLYIADTGNQVVRMLSTSGVVSTVAGIGVAGYSGDNGPATSAGLNGPWGVTAVGIGAGFYIADQNNQRIRFVNASGTISTIAGNGSAGFSGDTGPATSAQLNVPASVLVDVAGNIYVADSGNNRVRRINATTGVITTVAGNSGESISGDGGPADVAELYGPYAFALDTQGSLFIADVFHNRIRKVSANAAILNYPTQRVNRVSTPITQTMENDGNAPLNISSVAPVSNSQVDAGTTTCTSSKPLATLQQCVVGADFAPTSTGKLVNGTININSDAANSPGVLTLAGEVLDVDPTTVALASSLNPSTTGSAVTFTVTVTSTGSTPTGTVTLLEGSTSLGTATLASGVATFTLSNLTSGNHSLTASYGGDAQNASGVSSVLVQVVRDQLAATTTALTGSAGPNPAGAPVNFTATVSIVTANSGNGAISGSVSFNQGANVLGVANINAASATTSKGTASITLTNLPVGSDNIVAVYSGSTSYLGSSSSAFTSVVAVATTKTTLSPSANPSFAGAPLVLTATLLSNGGVPTGPVKFMDGSTVLGTATLNPQSVAILSVPGTSWTVGNHTLTAVYNGDANDSGSTSAPVVELINISPSTTSVTSSLNPSGLGASVTFTAAVSTQGGAPSGSVQFLDGATSLGSGTLSSTGTTTSAATFSISSLIIGSHPITAVYAGDPADSTSTSAVLTQTVQTATIATTLQSSVNPATFGAPLTLTSNVSGTGSTPTGTVVLLDGASTVATQPVPASGVVVFANPSLAIGTHTLTAAYSGDANHAANTSAALVQIIQQATATALTASASALTAGQSVTLTASVAGASAKPLSGNPAGSVTFTDAGALLATVTPDASGTAVYTTAGLLPGQHNILATYTGDSLDAASASSPVTLTVTIAGTSTTLSTSANPINSGSSLTLTSTVTGNGGTPTGTITFHDGGTVLTSVQLTSAGTATFSLSTLAPGIHQLSASYSGDSLDGPSVSPTTAEQVAQKTSVTLTSSQNPSLLQDSVTLTVTASNGAPSVPPTGSVTIMDGTTTLATLNLSPNGSVTFLFQAPSVGAHILVANYSGDAQNAPASSLPLTQTVNLRPSKVSFDPSTTALSSGQQLTLISVVQGSGSTPPTGTVTWTSGSTVLGSSSVDSTGLATLTIIPAQGTFATVAQYSGDALYAASASQPVTIVVGPTQEYTINLTPSTMSLTSGDHGTLNITVTSAATFSDTLALGCAGLPVDATCNFSVSQLTIAGGTTQSLSVIVDTGNPLGSGAAARNQQPGSLSNTYACALPLGAFFALLLGFNRRRLRKLNPKFALFALILLVGAGSSLLSGCGSTLNVNHTPAGSYTFQIIASGNKTAVTQTANVILTVTK